MDDISSFVFSTLSFTDFLNFFKSFNETCLDAGAPGAEGAVDEGIFTGRAKAM